MDDKPNVYEQFVLYMDQNNKGVQIGVYSAAVVGLAIAFRRTRAFKRFSRPNDIPNNYLTRRMELKGTVQTINPNGALLMVKHKPLINLLPPKHENLPVKISGVTINSHGLSWLQSIVAGHEVCFIPVLKEKESVQCEVLLQQQTHNKKQRILNVGPELIAIGFGQLSNIDQSELHPKYLLYYNQLLKAQSKYERQQLGYWYYAKVTTAISLKLARFIVHLFSRLNKSKKAKSSPKILPA